MGVVGDIIGLTERGMEIGMAQRGSEIGGYSNAADRAAFGSSGCQRGMERDGLAVLAARKFHQAMVPLTRLALAANFRHIHVLHAERMPREGAVLLVANHPSTWTDVVLLDAVLGRRFHFLAHEEQFHPWPRGVLLELYGTLPLSSREHRPDAMARNAVTFRRCEELFDRAEGVAVFPEGISRVDRGLLPLKHGAARLALSYAERRENRGTFALVPVGIYYSDRTAFRSDVTVQVGKAIPAVALRASGTADPEEAAGRLTDRMAEAMRGLGLEGMDRPEAGVFSALEPIAAGGAGSLELERARRLARSLADERWNQPEKFARLQRCARVFERMRRVLGVSESALAARSRTERRGAVLALVAGSVPALAGLAIHVLPAMLTHAATRRYASDPSRVAFARIASGFFFLVLAYGAGITLLLVGTRVHPVWVPALALLSALLGVFALGFAPRARSEYERCRLAWISRRHGRFVGRARREREILRARALALLA